MFVLSASLLVLAARPSAAQIDLSWNNCVIADTDAGDTQLPATSAAFVCNGGAVDRKSVFGSFKVPVPIADFFAVDVSIDLYNSSGTMPSHTFWHFQDGGCNSAGITVDDATTECHALQSPWGDGSLSDALVTAYQPG